MTTTITGAAVTATNFTGAGTALTDIGIRMADQWKLITQHTTNADITAWAKVAFTGAGFIGTGMSMSSGIFTFPQTGIYAVYVKAGFQINGSDSVEMATYVTTDNSTYVYADAIVDGNNGSGIRNGGASGLVIVDVTDTANVKVKFNASTLNSGSALNAYTATSTNPNATSVTFIRLGDT
jgi:hypothetical protein